MDDFRWEKHAIRLAQSRTRRSLLLKKPNERINDPSWSARQPRTWRGLSGFNTENILEDGVCRDKRTIEAK